MSPSEVSYTVLHKKGGPDTTNTDRLETKDSPRTDS